MPDLILPSAEFKLDTGKREISIISYTGNRFNHISIVNINGVAAVPGRPVIIKNTSNTKYTVNTGYTLYNILNFETNLFTPIGKVIKCDVDIEFVAVGNRITSLIKKVTKLKVYQ